MSNNLDRGFIDAKRLTNIAVNYYCREKWYLDYIKSISKPLQSINDKETLFEKQLGEYVKYNGQVLALKNFIDDRVDIIGRRTLIKEFVNFDQYSFYGYATNFNTPYYTWNQETDPSYVNLKGYISSFGSDYQWVKEEEDKNNNLTLWGYTSTFGSDYSWIKENKDLGYNFQIMIHIDIWSTLTQSQKDTLSAEIERYVIAPYNFKLVGYLTSCEFNGVDDYINLGIIPDNKTILKSKVDIYNTCRIGVANPVNNFFFGKVGSQITSGYGDTIDSSGYLPSGIHNFELNSLNKRTLVNGYVFKDFNSATFTPSNLLPYLKLGVFDSNGTKTYNNYKDYGGYIIKNGVQTNFTPHPDGYFFDNYGNTYYNKESKTNNDPLKVTTTIY